MHDRTLVSILTFLVGLSTVRANDLFEIPQEDCFKSNGAHSPCNVILYPKPNEADFAKCSGIYLNSVYTLNGRPVFINEAQSRLLAWNGNKWTISSTTSLELTLANPTDFAFYHFTNSEEPTNGWSAYKARAFSFYGFAVAPKPGVGINQWVKDRVGVYTLSTEEYNGHEVYISRNGTRKLVWHKETIYWWGIEDHSYHWKFTYSNYNAIYPGPNGVQSQHGFLPGDFSDNSDIFSGWDKFDVTATVQQAAFSLQQSSLEGPLGGVASGWWDLVADDRMAGGREVWQQRGTSRCLVYDGSRNGFSMVPSFEAASTAGDHPLLFEVWFDWLFFKWQFYEPALKNAQLGDHSSGALDSV